MKAMLFTMPTIPATIEERRTLRPIGRNTERYQRMIAELRQLAVAADSYGYTAFATTEHHFHTEGAEANPHPMLLFADLAARTEQLMFIPLSLVLPARDPIRLAEEVALFDQLYPGPRRGRDRAGVPETVGPDSRPAHERRLADQRGVRSHQPRDLRRIPPGPPQGVDAGRVRARRAPLPGAVPPRRGDHRLGGDGVDAHLRR